MLCRSEEPLKSAASKSCQLVDRRANESILQGRVIKSSLLSPKEPCTSKATGWKMYPLSINSRYFSILRYSASVAVVPGLHEEPSFRRLGARASTTITSHSNCLPFSQGIMVTLSGRLPFVRYSPRGSSIEGTSRDPNVCFMRIENSMTNSNVLIIKFQA